MNIHATKDDRAEKASDCAKSQKEGSYDRVVEMGSGMLKVDVKNHAFLTDMKYLTARAGRIIGQGTEGLTFLDCLLRASHSKQERQALFPGAFDLGNRNDLPSEQCTRAALILETELEGQPCSYDRLQDVAKGIERLTGRSFEDYYERDPAKAMKVAKLLHEFVSQRPHILTIISNPDQAQDARLDLTNPYAFGPDPELRLLVCDLQSRLTAEIPAKRLATIDRVFRVLRDRLDKAYLTLETEVKAEAATPEEVVGAYDLIAIDWLKPPLFPFKQEVLPLDEQLHLYFWVLDLLHYARGEQRLRDQRLYHCAVPTLIEDLGALDAVSFESLRPLPNAKVSEQALALRALLTKAVGQDCSDKVFREVLSDAANLLERYCWTTGVFVAQQVDAILAMAAVVVAFHIRRDPQHLQVSLPGSKPGSGSIKSKLRAKFSDVHEEYFRVFHYAIDWSQYALNGQTAVYEAQWQLKLRLTQRFVEIAQVHDTDLLDNALTNLENYALHAARAAVRRARKEH